ncbi:oxygenase MpaB family protein [Salinimicrobium xinjiangense]|uniref:oxygenase MpaB family protein n=1 Tax=Salinimicrobium xinjiangense TaxID=438596 RepID=UPI0003FACA18|nr:oxygenase MpaB family protein [Salinimicrobium xinjiangense]
MEYFVEKDSIVRQIWGKGDTILFIFAGASAEFALNRAVDWLYFTGRLPANPLGRLFSTVSYARKIVFSEQEDAHRAIDSIAAIHAAVEQKRGKRIPDWAYRDVLFMLIDYSIRAFEVFERELSLAEKEETFGVFRRVGERMEIPKLPQNFKEWEKMREEHLENDLYNGNFTKDLYRQYRKHLGIFRYSLLIEAQKLISPQKVKFLLGFNRDSLLSPVLVMYKSSRIIKADRLLRALILPSDYKKEIAELDVRSEEQ